MVERTHPSLNLHKAAHGQGRSCIQAHACPAPSPGCRSAVKVAITLADEAASARPGQRAGAFGEACVEGTPAGSTMGRCSARRQCLETPQSVEDQTGAGGGARGERTSPR